MDLRETVTTLGALSGFASLFWLISERFGSSLQLDLSVTNEGDRVSALTSIGNKGRLPKRLDFAALLVAPEAEDPGETVRQIARRMQSKLDVNEANDIWQFKGTCHAPHYQDASRAIIPLPFFHQERSSIAGETVRYRCTIEANRLLLGRYSVRLFVFPRTSWHDWDSSLRCAQDSFLNTPKN